MALRVCVVGCGAIGSAFAAHLACAPDTEVFAYDVSEEQVRAITEHGLRATGAVHLKVKVTATSHASDIPPCDFGIFATKSIYTRSAIKQTAHIFGEGGAVCSVQNGLGNEEVIAEHVRKVIRGTTSMAAHLVGPGHTRIESHGETWIGPFEPSGTSTEVAADLAELLRETGIPCQALPDARGAQWTKVIFNSAVNAVGGLTRLHHGAAARFPPTAAMLEALIEEGESVAQALGITLLDDPRRLLREGAAAAERRNPSMLVDVIAARPTEVDFLNGAIADLGEELGVSVLLDRAVWRLLKGLEHSWTDPA